MAAVGELARTFPPVPENTMVPAVLPELAETPNFVSTSLIFIVPPTVDVPIAGLQSRTYRSRKLGRKDASDLSEEDETESRKDPNCSRSPIINEDPFGTPYHPLPINHKRCACYSLLPYMQ